MVQRHAWLFSLAFIGLTTFAANASATSAQLSGSCEFKGGVDCKASCGQIDFKATCDAQFAASCRGQCTGQADLSCTGACSADCEAACNVDPGRIDCQGRCAANCGADCDAQCSASTHGATSQADCAGKCRASCNATCDGSCTGTPPQADCAAKCQASCSGQCTAKANVDCQIGCQARGNASCEVDANAQCSANCDAHGGVIVCDGVAQVFVETVEAAYAWLQQHVVVRADSGSSCTGNTCEAHASASVSTKCSTASVPGSGAPSALGAEMGVVGAALLIGMARKRARRRTARD